MFCQKLYETDCTGIAMCKSPTECYKIFWKNVCLSMTNTFQPEKIKLKEKNIESPRKKAEVTKSSKRKKTLV